jgi:hypothetical protein
MLGSDSRLPRAAARPGFPECRLGSWAKRRWNAPA